MICNYFRVIHIIIEKIIIGNTQPTYDVPRTSPEGPLKIPTSGTCRGPLGESQGTNTKIDNFMKKWFLRSNSPFITYVFLLFTGRTNTQKLTSLGPDQMMGRSRDVRGTLVKHVF